MKETLESKIDRLHRSVQNRYNDLDGKLDGILKDGGSSKLTPVYALILLAVTFWAGCQVGGM